MEDLQVSGRSSVASSRPKHKQKTVGINFSQRKRTKPKQTDEMKVVSTSKDSRASTTYLNSPSGPNMVGNPQLSIDDVLQRLSRSLPPSENNSYQTDLPVRDSAVMKPDFSEPRTENKKEVTFQEDEAACKIQTFWKEKRKKSEERQQKEIEDNTFKMSEQLKEMLDQEKKKMQAERKEEAAAEKHKKVDIENRKHEARLKAIEELNKKREEKRQLQQKMVEEELELAKKSKQKVKRPKTATPKKKKPSSEANTPSTASPHHITTTTESQTKPQNSTYDNLIDEIFLSNSRQSLSQEVLSEIETPRIGWGSKPSESLHEEAAQRASLRNSLSCREEKKAFSSLLETLKVLEAESEEALSEAKSSSIIIPPTPKLTQGEVYKLDRLSGLEGVMPSGKIQSLLHFLDNAENSYPQSEVESVTSAAALEQQRLRSVSAVADEVSESILDTKNQLSSKASQIEMLKSELTNNNNRSAQLQAQIFATKLESDEKSKAVAMLRRALDEQRDLTLRLTNEQEKDAQQRLANQKAEYETAIQRHLGFIDQLIGDKKDLSNKVESLMLQSKNTEKKLGDRVRQLEDNQKVEAKKQKETIEAAEKIKRERWIAEKSNQIKEMTVKGLEPEIQRLISKNKAEIKRLNAVQEAELLAADERASKRFVSQVEELRKQLDEEKEAACARERDYALKRFQKQVEQEEEAYQQQRRRLYTEVQEEKDRAAELLNKHRSQLDQDKKSYEEELNTKMAKIQAQHTIEVENIRQEHDNALRDLKLRAEVEKEHWLENQKQRQGAALLAKEREIRSTLKNERNKEIELVISKLEEQAALQREESQGNLDCRMKRLRDKYESQLSDLEHLNSTTQGKLNVMKERVTDLEADNIRLRGNVKSIERQFEDIEKVNNRLKAERDKVEEVIRGEFSERLVRLEEENKTNKTELVECRTRHTLQLEKQSRNHESEMNEVQSRITSAFSKRDEVIKELRDKSGAAAARADHLEALLIKQREQLLKPLQK